MGVQWRGTSREVLRMDMDWIQKFCAVSRDCTQRPVSCLPWAAEKMFKVKVDVCLELGRHGRPPSSYTHL